MFISHVLRQMSAQHTLVNSLGSDGNFETALSAGWYAVSGSPTLSADYAKFGTQSLKAFGTVSQAFRNRVLSGSVTRNLYLCCFARCLRYVQGGLGIRIVGVANQASINSVSADWVFCSNTATTYGNIDVDMGSFDSANLDGYVDGAFLIDITNMNITKSDMDAFMDKVFTQGYFTRRDYMKV